MSKIRFATGFNAASLTSTFTYDPQQGAINYPTMVYYMDGSSEFQGRRECELVWNILACDGKFETTILELFGTTGNSPVPYVFLTMELLSADDTYVAYNVCVYAPMGLVSGFIGYENVTCRVVIFGEAT